MPSNLLSELTHALAEAFYGCERRNAVIDMESISMRRKHCLIANTCATNSICAVLIANSGFLGEKSRTNALGI
jgi:hypothetical protein